MPSFNEIIGAIVTFIVLANASGHGEWLSKGIAEIRNIAVKQAKADWGCLSVFSRGACSGYDARRYR